MAPKPVKPDTEDESLPASAWMAYSLSARADDQLNQSKCILNSGASKHICTNPFLFIQVAELRSTITGIEIVKVAVARERSVKFKNGQL